MSERNPASTLPLFASPLFCDDPKCGITHTHHPGLGALREAMTPRARGIAGGEDAQHGPIGHAERMPAFVLEALGLALQSFNRLGVVFSFEQVRLQAEQSEAVKGWLAASTRTNVLGGWTRSRVRLFKLVRCGDQETTRANRRGARATLWRFPSL